LLFVGGASRNIGRLTVACNRIGQRKRCDCPRWTPLHQPHWHWQRTSGARRTHGARRKQLQNNAGRVSIFICLHWPILLNNMLTVDDCNLAACGLIQLRGSAVLNENVIVSNNYYFDRCCTGTPSKTVEAVDATRSIINNSDGCSKATT
jgi:hypothetical protein